MKFIIKKLFSAKRNSRNQEINRIFDLSSHIVGIADINGIFTYVNKATEEIFGYSNESMIGRSFADHIFLEDRSHALNIIATIRSVKRIVNLDNRILKKNGDLKWVSWNFSFDEKTEEILIVCRDISDSKRNVDIIRNSEKHYKALIENLKIGVLKQEKDSQITVSNSAALEMLGVTQDQLLGRTSFDPDWNVIHADGTDFPGATHPVPTAIATQKPVRDVVMGVYRPLTKDRVWLLVNAEPQFDLSGEFDHVICTFTDITKERKTLVQKQEELIDILDSTAAYFATMDLNFNFTFMNKSLRKILGFSEDFDISRYNLNELRIQETDISLDDLSRILLAEGIWSGANTYKNFQNKDITVWHVVLLHRNENGVPTHISATAIDISDRRALEEEKHLNKIQSEFVSMVSHEFRTPLTIFRTSLELLEIYLRNLNIELPEKLNQRLLIMDQEIDRLISVITDLITIGKISTGGIKTHKKEASLVSIVESCITRFNLTGQDTRTIQCIVSGAVRNMELDEFLITHIIDNVISNAIKFSKDCAAPEIYIQFQENLAQIRIKDFGIGIPENEMHLLFNSFFRGSNSNNIKGTGLGLVIVKKFVDLHQGEISISSQENIGTEVLISIPFEA